MPFLTAVKRLRSQVKIHHLGDCQGLDDNLFCRFFLKGLNISSKQKNTGEDPSLGGLSGHQRHHLPSAACNGEQSLALYFCIYSFVFLYLPATVNNILLYIFVFYNVVFPYFCICLAQWTISNRLALIFLYFSILYFCILYLSPTKKEPVREVEYDEDGCYAPDQFSVLLYFCCCWIFVFLRRRSQCERLSTTRMVAMPLISTWQRSTLETSSKTTPSS